MTEPKREGPRLMLHASCLGCVHEHSEGYRAQSDSGHDVYCKHPRSPLAAGGFAKHNGFARIGDTTWDTPKWCPLMAATKAREGIL